MVSGRVEMFDDFLYMIKKMIDRKALINRIVGKSFVLEYQNLTYDTCGLTFYLKEWKTDIIEYEGKKSIILDTDCYKLDGVEIYDAGSAEKLLTLFNSDYKFKPNPFYLDNLFIDKIVLFEFDIVRNVIKYPVRRCMSIYDSDLVSTIEYARYVDSKMLDIELFRKMPLLDVTLMVEYVMNAIHFEGYVKVDSRRCWM